jgi:RNA polymerase sigma factor (TIGR02999 family)
MRAVESGRNRFERLLPEVYDRLEEVAAAQLRKERPDHTLEPAALVHEVFLRFVRSQTVHWKDRSHFCALAGRAMRQVLVDHARRRARAIRGGGLRRITLSESRMPGADAVDLDLDDLETALGHLAELDPRAARVVELRFFSGLSMDEIAAELGLALRTAQYDWEHARAWLLRELSG